jgi:hypothetical protein
MLYIVDIPDDTDPLKSGNKSVQFAKNTHDIPAHADPLLKKSTTKWIHFNKNEILR